MGLRAADAYNVKSIRGWVDSNKRFPIQQRCSSMDGNRWTDQDHVLNCRAFAVAMVFQNAAIGEALVRNPNVSMYWGNITQFYSYGEYLLKGGEFTQLGSFSSIGEYLLNWGVFPLNCHVCLLDHSLLLLYVLLIFRNTLYCGARTCPTMSYQSILMKKFACRTNALYVTRTPASSAFNALFTSAFPAASLIYAEASNACQSTGDSFWILRDRSKCGKVKPRAVKVRATVTILVYRTCSVSSTTFMGCGNKLR